MDEKINGRTPEDLKDALMRCGRRHCKAESGDCPYYIDCLVGATRLKLMKDAFDYIRYLESERDAALAKVPKWISVAERLPPPETEIYLATCVLPNGDCTVHVVVWAWDENDEQGDWICQDIVTHWMQWPESPEEEEK